MYIYFRKIHSEDVIVFKHFKMWGDTKNGENNGVYCRASGRGIQDNYTQGKEKWGYNDLLLKYDVIKCYNFWYIIIYVVIIPL